jgi:hypothetical protein
MPNFVKMYGKYFWYRFELKLCCDSTWHCKRFIIIFFITIDNAIIQNRHTKSHAPPPLTTADCRLPLPTIYRPRRRQLLNLPFTRRGRHFIVNFGFKTKQSSCSAPPIRTFSCCQVRSF